MKKVDLIENKIAFLFLENVNNKGFSGKTESGIIVQQSEQNQIDQARWGEVIKCSPEVSEIDEGQFILIEPMGWTPGIQLEELEEDTFWITTEDRIMAVADTKPDLNKI